MLAAAHAGNPPRNGPLVGDFYQGGVVFWVDQTKNGQHGLVVDTHSKGNLVWSPTLCAVANTTSGPYAGRQNTLNIVNTCGAAGAPAAYA